MLLPWEAVAAWAALAVLPALATWRGWRSALGWWGLAVAGGGAVYLAAAMARRPPGYYAILEFLTASTAVGVGLIMAAVGIVHVWVKRPIVAPDPRPDHDSGER